MIKIGVLTNKTWAKQRPPLTVRPASAALLAEISRMAVKPAALRGSRGKQTGKKPSRPVKSQPDTRSQPARPQPQNGKQPYSQAKSPPNASSPFASPRPQNGKPVGNSPAPDKRPGSYNGSNGRDTGTQRNAPQAPANNRQGFNQPRPNQPGSNYRPNGTPANSNAGKSNFTRPNPADRNPAENRSGGQPSNNGKWNGSPAKTGDVGNGMPNQGPAASKPGLNGKPGSGPVANGNVLNGRSGSGPAANNTSLNGRSGSGPAAPGLTSNGKSNSGPAANGSPVNGKPATGPAANGSGLNGKPMPGPVTNNSPAVNGNPGAGPAAKGSEPQNLAGQTRVERNTDSDLPARKPPEMRSQDSDRPDFSAAAPTARPENEAAKALPKGLIQDPAPQDPVSQEVPAPQEVAAPSEMTASQQLPAFEDLSADAAEHNAVQEPAEEKEQEKDMFLEDKNDTGEASFEPFDIEEDVDKAPDKMADQTDSPEHGDQPGPSAGIASNDPDSKPAPANGKPRSPGNIGRSSLFRPDVFASMSTFRVPPKMEPRGEPPKAEPPRVKPWNEPPHTESTRVDRPVQIPMEVHLPSQNGKNGSSHNGNGKSMPGYSPAQPDNNPGGQTDDLRKALQRVLEQQKDLPEQTAILGVGEDGLPVLFDLQDPTPGAVVTISDERQAELEILRTAIASLAGRSSPRSVQFLVFSVEPEKWRTWIKQQGFDRYCLAVVGAEDESIREWTLRLADWTEQRRLGQRGGPPVLLVMDTLNFLTRLPYDVRLNFEWMAKEGPQAQIWPLAAISSDLAKSLSQRRLLRAFPMRIFGCFQDPADYVQLANVDEEETAEFGRSGEFAVRLGDHWLRFHLLGRK